MRRIVNGIIVMALIAGTLVSSTVAIAQRPSAAAVVVPQSPGAYEFTNYDRARLESEVLAILQQRSAADAQYVRETVDRINSQLSGFRNTHLLESPTGYTLGRLLNRYRVGSNTAALDAKNEAEVQQALNAVRRFQVAVADVKSLIQSVAAIPAALQPTGNTLTVNGSIVEVPSYGRVNLGAIIDFYASQVREVEELVAQARIVVQKTTGVVEAQSVLNIQLGPFLSPERIAEMQRRVTADTTLTVGEIAALNNLNTFSRRAFMDLIEVFGEQRAYRVELNEAGRLQRIESFREIMFLRSLMRAYSGIPGFLGSFAINYRTRSFNWDLFSEGTSIEWLAEPLRNENDIQRMQDTIVQKLYQLETRTVSPDNLEDMRRRTRENPLFAVSAITSLTTFIRGQRPLAEINKIVLKELALDLEEEVLLARGKFIEMRELYQRRWYHGRTEAEVRDLRAKVASLLGDSTQQPTGPRALNRGANVTSSTGVFNLAMSIYRPYAARYGAAMQVQDLIDKGTAELLGSTADENRQGL